MGGRGGYKIMKNTVTRRIQWCPMFSLIHASVVGIAFQSIFLPGSSVLTLFWVFTLTVSHSPILKVQLCFEPPQQASHWMSCVLACMGLGWRQKTRLKNFLFFPFRWLSSSWSKIDFLTILDGQYEPANQLLEQQLSQPFNLHPEKLLEGGN